MSFCFLAFVICMLGFFLTIVGRFSRICRLSMDGFLGCLQGHHYQVQVIVEECSFFTNVTQT